ncbi:hypothetical protein QYF36_021967 [Acer negundo]|nr:hypothetical protein QYF36_021967 [Acer negundo]
MENDMQKNVIELMTTIGTVWLNPKYVIWFWDHDGSCNISVKGRNEFLTLLDTAAEDFARVINGGAVGGEGAQQTGRITVEAGERQEGVDGMIKMPLTEFLIEMMKADRAKLEKADPVKLAAKGHQLGRYEMTNNEKRPVIFAENRPNADSKIMTMHQALKFANRMMPKALIASGFKSEIFASDIDDHGGLWFRINYGKRVPA